VAGVGIIEGIDYLLTVSQADSEMFKNPEINFNMAMMSLFVLVISGIFAGMIPARRAVRVRPIDALRDE
jgi:putative ABC transport system permease protein